MIGFGATAAVVAWAAIRLFAILRAQVLWRAAVGPAWILLAAAIALVLAPLTPGLMITVGLRGGAPDLVAWAEVALLEFALGTVVGLLAALPGHALLGAGAHGGALLGGAAPSRAVVGLFVAVTLVLGLSLGLHRPLLVSMSATFSTWPVGRPEAWGLAELDTVAVGTTVARAAHAVTLLALTLATPVLLAAAIADVTLRLIGRGAPPAGDLTDALRPWARATFAVVALGASWAAYDFAWARALG